MRTFTHHLLPLTALLFAACSSPNQETKGEHLSQIDFAGKTFNVAMLTSAGKAVDGGVAMKATFGQDTTGQLRMMEDGKLQATGFTWQIGGDSLRLKMISEASRTMKLKIQRDGSGFMLSDKDGSMLLTP